MHQNASIFMTINHGSAPVPVILRPSCKFESEATYLAGRCGVGTTARAGPKRAFYCLHCNTSQWDVKTPPRGRLMRCRGTPARLGCRAPALLAIAAWRSPLCGRRGPWPPAPCRSRRDSPRHRTAAPVSAPGGSNGSSHAPQCS